jgi:hypothetical protein
MITNQLNRGSTRGADESEVLHSKSETQRIEMAGSLFAGTLAAVATFSTGDYAKQTQLALPGGSWAQPTLHDRR